MNRLTITTSDGKVHEFETEETFEDFNDMDPDQFFSVNEEAIFNTRFVVSLRFTPVPVSSSGQREVLGGHSNLR